MRLFNNQEAKKGSIDVGEEFVTRELNDLFLRGVCDERSRRLLIVGERR